MRRATAQWPEQVLSDRLWKPLGMEQDGYLQVDSSGAPLAASGLNLQLRDLARFCEMMRLGGRYNGRQIVPAVVVADIARAGQSRSPGSHVAWNPAATRPGKLTRVIGPSVMRLASKIQASER